MATKFYLPSTGAAGILPAYSTSWDDTTTASPSKLRAVIAKGTSNLATKSITETTSTDKHFCIGMWVSDRLAPQAIGAQAITCSISCSEYDAKANMTIHWIVRLVDAAGTTFQTLFAFLQRPYLH